MRSPCEKCIEATFCRGTMPCRKKQKYDEWKKKAKETSDHVKRVMERRNNHEKHTF